MINAALEQCYVGSTLKLCFTRTYRGKQLQIVPIRGIASWVSSILLLGCSFGLLAVGVYVFVVGGWGWSLLLGLTFCGASWLILRVLVQRVFTSMRFDVCGHECEVVISRPFSSKVRRFDVREIAVAYDAHPKRPFVGLYFSDRSGVNPIVTRLKDPADLDGMRTELANLGIVQQAERR